MAKRTECMELELELKDKQLAELQDLHNSQKALNVQLSDNLEKTQRRLGDTEHALCDLEERQRHANITIKEKEYLISNLLRSGSPSSTILRRLLKEIKLILSP